MSRKPKALDEREAVVERLREFIRFGYMTASEVARRIGIHNGTVYSWLLGEFLPTNPERLTAFLDSLPVESNSGIAPTGYEYREYKNWRGIPKPRRCPFCKKAKGEIRKVRAGFQGVCPNCGATGPKQDSHDEALMAWNGKSLNSWRSSRPEFGSVPDCQNGQNDLDLTPSLGSYEEPTDNSEWNVGHIRRFYWA